jgi:hypothetical protein
MSKVSAAFFGRTAIGSTSGAGGRLTFFVAGRFAARFADVRDMGIVLPFGTLGVPRVQSRRIADMPMSIANSGGRRAAVPVLLETSARVASNRFSAAMAATEVVTGSSAGPVYEAAG